jgi:hypothetical protein
MTIVCICSAWLIDLDAHQQLGPETGAGSIQIPTLKGQESLVPGLPWYVFGGSKEFGGFHTMARSGQKSIAQGLPWVIPPSELALKGPPGTSGWDVHSEYSIENMAERAIWSF